MSENNVLIFNDDIIASVQKKRLARKGFFVDHTSRKKEAIDLFGKKKYDFVLINFSVLDGAEVLSHINEKEPSQRIITLSTVNGCSDPKGCEHCLQNYNKRRLMMPNDLTKLDHLLNNFDNTKCEYALTLKPF